MVTTTTTFLLAALSATVAQAHLEPIGKMRHLVERQAPASTASTATARAATRTHAASASATSAPAVTGRVASSPLASLQVPLSFPFLCLADPADPASASQLKDRNCHDRRSHPAFALDLCGGRDSSRRKCSQASLEYARAPFPSQLPPKLVSDDNAVCPR